MCAPMRGSSQTVATAFCNERNGGMWSVMKDIIKCPLSGACALLIEKCDSITETPKLKKGGL